MLRETLSQTDLLELPIFAFLVFFTTFVFVVVRVLARGRHDARFAAMAAMPLADDAQPSCTPSAFGATPGSARSRGPGGDSTEHS